LTNERPVYDPAKVEAAVAAFRGMGLNPAEALLAAVRVVSVGVADFRDAAQAIRTDHGDAVAEFARAELNDAICDLQDTIPVVVRAYNALLRDEDGTPEDAG
jgi:hypothetical protein